MTLQEETQKLLNILDIIKKLFIFGLTVAFLTCTTLILTNFFAYQTTYRVSSNKTDLTIPSMTLCYILENNEGHKIPKGPGGPKGIDKFALSNGAMKDGQSFPLPVSFKLHTQTMDKLDMDVKSFDLANQTALKEYFNARYDQIWKFTCMSLQNVRSDTCLPCMTLNIPNDATAKMLFILVC